MKDATQAAGTPCEHNYFAARVDVNRLEDCARFIACVRVHCAECSLEFSFTGLPHAISVERPCVNIDATEAMLPMEPGPQPIVSRTIPVEMPVRRES
jgi:hypothetical protein